VPLRRPAGERPAGERRAGERGSVLALVPAGFLVLVLLAALAVDTAAAYQAQQSLHDSLALAASDAVTGGLDRPAFYSSGVVRLTPDLVEQTLCTALAAEDLSQFHDLRLAFAVSPTEVEVTAEATIDAVFGRAIPGYGPRAVSAAAVATVEAAPEAAVVGPFPSPVPLRC
jgi:hypothetical protein